MNAGFFMIQHDAFEDHAQHEQHHGSGCILVGPSGRNAADETEYGIRDAMRTV